MEARDVVSQELERGLPQWQSLPAFLQPALEQHCDNLAQLAASLHSAGRDTETIRTLVGELLRSYGHDLVKALETSK